MSETLAHIWGEKPRTKDVFITESLTFQSLLLSPSILQGLKDAGFYKPSPIQLKAIPLGKCGLDLIAQAKSGTGKTVVFTIIALEMVDTTRNALQVLAFAPTREIAVQIEDVIKTIGKHIKPKLEVGSFIGGMPIQDDITRIKKCHIAVGAPGRLKHLVEKSYLKTRSIRLVIFDEADKLMKESFQNDINYIYSKLPEGKQIITASATYTEELCKFLEYYMQSPTFVTPEVDNPLLLGLKQFVAVVKEHININRQMQIKTEELKRLLSHISYTQCLVFFNSQSRAEGISNTLNKDNWNTAYISGAQTQTERLATIQSLKKFECRILLTTDLTARGIDAANVDLIINYDVPYETATYLHRMGRAGRYGSNGICVTIAGDKTELKKLQEILGEVGGTELSIAKVPTDETMESVWTSDYNSFEKLNGILKGANVTNGTNKELLKLVFDMKATQKENIDAEMVSEDLTKLKVNEDTDLEPIENESKKAKTVEGADICQGVSWQSNLKIDSDSLLKRMAEADESLQSLINRKYEKDKGQEMSKIKPKNHLLDLLMDSEAPSENRAHNQELSQTTRDDASNNKRVLSFNELHPWVSMESPSTSGTNADLVNSVENSEEICKTLDSNEDQGEPDEEEERILSMDELHPWVPLEEGESVFTTNPNQINLLDSIKRKKKPSRKQRPSDDENQTKQNLSNTTASDNEVLLRNVALFNFCKLAGDSSTSETKERDDSITNYLNCLKRKREQEVAELSEDLKNVSCDIILKNIDQFVTQHRDEIKDPMENIFRLAYYDILKKGKSWKNALGDKYEPVVENNESESESDEAMEYEFEDEYDKGEEEYDNGEEEYDNGEEEYADCEEEEYDYGEEEEHADGEEEYVDYEDYERQEDYHEDNQVRYHYSTNNSQEVASVHQQYPMTLAQSYIGNSDDVNGEKYASYFEDYGQQFLNNMTNFEDVDCFDRYFIDWQQQVVNCTEFVQQNIYLQEMNDYSLQRGNASVNNYNPNAQNNIQDMYHEASAEENNACSSQYYTT